MKANDMRAFIEALERLAKDMGIEIDHSLQLSGVVWSEGPEWHLAIETDADATRALAFWDAIGELEAFQSLMAVLHVSVGWSKEGV